ncbi:substrate-binding periplasmic protein [Silvanigrella aquatica]|uniref:Solute-binding protein family 3/N-terminal domain-containing protein n=1 Tax=Silvanigrella aquatica TaxID=1915309 RepID=A0A1L4D2M9_9BACT|nr:transporter substrate-binding domain-containing protein [Silvanigrella aquatica]APJ04465.1 hypothetical protein AXG55_11310 [Silvanigrella aquatica]
MTIIRINLKIRNIVLFLFLISAVNANSLESNIKTIKIAYYQDYPPLSYTENNKINGIFIDIAELILGKKMGYKVIQEGFPWERAQEMVKKGEFDAHITLFNKKRDEFLFFQKNTSYEASLGYAYSIKSPKLKEIENIKSIDDLKKIRLIDYIGNAWTKENLYIDEKSRENVYFLPSLINTLKMLNAKC